MTKHSVFLLAIFVSMYAFPVFGQRYAPRRPPVVESNTSSNTSPPATTDANKYAERINRSSQRRQRVGENRASDEYWKLSPSQRENSAWYLRRPKDPMVQRFRGRMKDGTVSDYRYFAEPATEYYNIYDSMGQLTSTSRDREEAEYLADQVGGTVTVSQSATSAESAIQVPSRDSDLKLEKDVTTLNLRLRSNSPRSLKPETRSAESEPVRSAPPNTNSHLPVGIWWNLQPISPEMYSVTPQYRIQRFYEIKIFKDGTAEWGTGTATPRKAYYNSGKLRGPQRKDGKLEYLDADGDKWIVQPVAGGIYVSQNNSKPKLYTKAPQSH